MIRLLVIVFVVSLYSALMQWESLPENMASKFDFNGQPTSWMSKDVYMALQVFLYVFFFAMFYGFSKGIKHIGPRFINLPNKNYWFNEKNEKASREYLSKHMALLGVVNLVFFMILFHFLIKANESSNPQLDPSFPYVVIGFVLYTFIWGGQLIYRFKKPISKKVPGTFRG